MKLKHNIRKTLIIVLGSFVLSSNAQNIKPLHIGDNSPDILLPHVANYKTNRLKLSSFKDKLIILDFGSTGCHPCIEAIKALDSLKKNTFKNGIEGFLVTSEKRDRVDAFLSKSPIGKTLQSPIIFQDSTLEKYFPHVYIPHDVWINKGKIIAITDDSYIDAKNINAVLNGDKIDWPVKHDENYDVDQYLMMLNRQNIPNYNAPQKIYNYSVVTGYMDGAGVHISKKLDTANLQYKVSWINLPIIKLYLLANNTGWTTFRPNQIVIEAKDTSRFYEGTYHGEWDQKNTYCYETTFPASLTVEKRTAKISNDLDASLGLHGRMETKLIDCWVFDKIKQNVVLNMSKRPANDSLYSSSNKLGYDNLPSIIFQLQKNPNPPIVDETHTNWEAQDKIYLKLKKQDLQNFENVNKLLNRYGYQIYKAKREVQLLVITEN